jgi:hypothetical protein
MKLIVKSISEEKGKHLTAAGTSGTGLAVSGHAVAADSTIGHILDWMPHAAVLAGFALSCALLYKTYLEIRLAKRELENDRESE